MLQLEAVSKVFEKGTIHAHQALDSLELTLAPGDFVTVIGSNGAGKSTLFNAICGNFEVDTGRILLDGQEITYQREHQRAAMIGRLFQDPMKGTAPDMTLEENLSLAYSRNRRSPLGPAVRKQDQRRFRDALATFDMGLENRMKAKVGLLSGGQRQAMTLLMATIASPKLLLLDEHTAALDPAAAEKVLQITQTIVREKRLTTMMITHNIYSALQLGNRTLMMDAGRIILDITGAERKEMTVEKLLDLYAGKQGKRLGNDRMLFTRPPANA